MEKEKGISPDPENDAFMKANAIEGKREGIETEYVLHILGLGVCADTLVHALDTPQDAMFAFCWSRVTLLCTSVCSAVHPVT